MSKERPFITTSPASTLAELQEAADENTAPDRLRELAHKTEVLAFQVAKNKSAPPDLLEELASPVDGSRPRGIFNPPINRYTPWCYPSSFEWRSSARVREAIAQNPNAPPVILFALGLQFPRALLQNPALPLLLMEGTCLQTIPPDLLSNLLMHDDLFELLFDFSQSHPNAGVQLTLAHHPRSPPDTLSRLAQSTNVYVRGAVARNPSTTREILERLCQDPNEEVKRTALWSLEPDEEDDEGGRL